jgi:hypothetical protein
MIIMREMNHLDLLDEKEKKNESVVQYSASKKNTI